MKATGTGIEIGMQTISPGQNPVSDTQAEPKVQNPNTILVIDDDPTVRDLISHWLIKDGFHVETAANGREGLQRAREIQSDAITLDVLMPEMDGWTVLSTLKNDADLANIPVVMVTIVDDKNRGFTLGASEYLTKPISYQRLTAVLNKYRRQAANGRV